MLGGKPALCEVVLDAWQEGDDCRRTADQERLERTQQALARRAHSHRAQVDERLGPQVANLEDEPCAPMLGGEPSTECGKRMNRRADDCPRRTLAGLDYEEHRQERQHVELASPRVTAIGDRLEPYELHLVEPLDSAQGTGREAPLPAAVVAGIGREDRDRVAPSNEMAGERVVARAGRVRWSRGVVVDDPDSLAAIPRLVSRRGWHRPSR